MSAEAKARRQSRAEVAGGRGFMAAKATMKRVIAGNRGQGASIALRRRKAPGVQEAHRVDARRVESVLGFGGVNLRGVGESRFPREAQPGRRGCQKLLSRIVWGKPKKLPSGCGWVKGGKQLARESSPNRPTTGRERREAFAVTNPRDPRSAQGRGNVEGSR